MKRKLVLIFIIIIVLIVIIFGVKFIVSKDDNLKVCDEVINSLNEKKNVLLFIYPENSGEQAIATYNGIKNNYPNEKIYKINYEESNKKCFKDLLKKDNLYETIKEDMIPVVYMYKSGKYIGQMSGLEEYSKTEDFFVDNEIFKKNEIKDKLTLNKYKKNIIKKEYILFIIDNEQKREKYNSLMKKYFDEYSYDIINMYSSNGEKIMREVENKYIVPNDYPVLIYFEKENVSKIESIYDEKTISKFKTELNKK